MSEPPRVLVVGAGSIGTRHIRNLVALGADVEFVDPWRDRGSAIATNPGSSEAVDPAPGDYDGIVIATPNSMHREHLDWALESKAVVLVEKPMVTSANELHAGLLADADRILVGYNLRFHSGYSEVRERIMRGDIGRPVSARLWFGSYLPDWRPHVDYRESYSARRELGGGVLRDASHELDLAGWFFGSPLDVASAWIGRLGDLEIDVEDTVRTVLVSADGVPVSIDLDYLSRIYRRGIEVTGTEGTVRFDWALRSISNERVGSTEIVEVIDGVDESYVRLATAFLRRIGGDQVDGAANGVDGRHSVELVELIEERA